jgi:hypothetical protein
MAAQTNVNAIIRATVAAFFFMSAGSTSSAELMPELRGTYSSLAYHKEAGDLLGYEVRFIPTKEGTRAVVQMSEGEPGEVYVVEVKASGRDVAFDMPLSATERGSFTGKLGKTGLVGVLTFPAGASEKITLSKGASYWEKDYLALKRK